MLDIIIKNGQCYIDGGLETVDVAIKNGKICIVDKFNINK